MNEKLKSIVIDDEQDAVLFINTLIDDHCPMVEVVATANSAAEGAEMINQFDPDLVFLDIQMPYENGFELLARFPSKTFDVVFITAYNHYAIQAIKFSALDYILKPIDIGEFVKAVNKVVEKRATMLLDNKRFETLLYNLRSSFPLKLAISTQEGIEFINTKEIVRIEADGSYCWFYMTNGRKLIVSKYLKDFQELLTGTRFLRIHNSHIINLDFVKRYMRRDTYLVEMKDGSLIPLSKNKKELFLKMVAG